ncbi:MAG: hypothetical protein ISR98_01995 [Parcubacteria group bacterium]|nr:hypothetical protein [Parcubacteria group bacterium]
MKIKLFFDSVEEFAVFILSASSMKLDLEYKRLKTNYPQLGFLHMISEVHVNGTAYSVEHIGNKEPAVAYKIVNFMLNDVQIKNDAVYITGLAEDIDGSEKVHEHILKGLPESFLLIEGWRTDHTNYLFRKLN